MFKLENEMSSKFRINVMWDPLSMEEEKNEAFLIRVECKNLF